MSRSLEPWVILARMQRRAARSGVVLPTRRAHAAVDRLRAQAADPLADRVYRQRFDTAGPCRESVCMCRGGGPHAPGCPVYVAELQAATADALRVVRERARAWVRLSDEFDHDLTCTGESFQEMRAALDDFDRACEASLVAQDAPPVLPEFRE